MSLFEDSNSEILWKRPSEYIIDLILNKEILYKFPMKNIKKYKKYIYDMYNKDLCPVDYKKRFSDNYFINDKNHEYTSENKRSFKFFFKIFDKNDYYIVKHLEKDQDHEYINVNSAPPQEYHKKDEKNIAILNKVADNINLGGGNVNNNSTGNNEYLNNVKNNSITKTFLPNSICIDENSSFFVKWISSILQFIKEFEIYDV